MNVRNDPAYIETRLQHCQMLAATSQDEDIRRIHLQAAAMYAEQLEKISHPPSRH